MIRDNALLRIKCDLSDGMSLLARPSQLGAEKTVEIIAVLGLEGFLVGRHGGDFDT